MPDISIITPVRNNADTIRHAIASVTHQDVHCQHVIVDGASSDHSLAVVEQLKTPEMVVISEPDNGLYDAINKGISAANGEIIGILHADDYYPTRDTLASVVAAFADPDVDACYGDLKYVERGNVDRVARNWSSGEFEPRKFYSGWMPPHPTFFLRKSRYDQFGFYRLDLGTAADYEFMLRVLFKHRLRAVYIPRVLVHMRTHGASNARLSNRIRANRMDRHAWRVNDLKPRPWTMLAKPLRKIHQWF